MKKTFLLTQTPGGFSTVFSKWVSILFGFFNTIYGIYMLTERSMPGWLLALSAVLIVGGLIMLIRGFVLFSPANMFAPKIEIDEDTISIRADVFTRKSPIHWKEIKRIEFKSYTLEFQFSDNKTQLMILPTNAATAVEIKKSLREIAEKKQINVTAG